VRHLIQDSENTIYSESEPLARYADWCKRPSHADRMLLVDFSLNAYWLENSPQILLTAIYLQCGAKTIISVTDADLNLPEETSLSVVGRYKLWAEKIGFAQYNCGGVSGLSPLCIPKPWGQEIWYSGVETRGVCSFSSGGGETPIPWLQAVVPDSALGSSGEALVLLKILDPSPEPVIGDLYFELHEEKQEVYVVTHIDEAAWPDGTGYIRMGFDASKVAAFEGDEEKFRNAYLQAVEAYEVVRREIDELGPDNDASQALLAEELRLRNAMDGFSHLQSLSLGDVVKVPLLTPHSLQHGVRTVEFQTPVYERKILSFAQKVLTQDHWDTREAVRQMRLEQVERIPFDVLSQRKGVLVERIVDFNDFEVHRVSLHPDTFFSVESLMHYGLIIVVEGSLSVDGMVFGSEQALILPRDWGGKLIPAQPTSPLVFLLAMPTN
jgi:hypothetical protein